MADTNKIEAELLRVKFILDDDSTDQMNCSELERLVGAKLPRAVCNAIHHCEEINAIGERSEFHFFEGLDLISYEDLVHQYQEKDENDINSFFGAWELDSDFNVRTYPVWNSIGEKSWHTGRRVAHDLVSELEEDYEIKNVRDFMPLFSFQGDYILYGLPRESRLSGLLFAPLEDAAVIIAPSLPAHIDDLLDGLNSDRYFYNEVEESFIYPASWFYRKQLEKGLVKMDEFGDVTER